MKVYFSIYDEIGIPILLFFNITAIPIVDEFSRDDKNENKINVQDELWTIRLDET